MHRLLVIRLQDALQLGIAGDLAMLPGSWLLGLIVVGVGLGYLGVG